MLDFFKYVINCLCLMFDYLVGNVDKTPLEQKQALVALGGGVIFTSFFLLLLLKVSPQEWSQFKAGMISMLGAFLAMIIYFAIIYFVIMN